MLCNPCEFDSHYPGIGFTALSSYSELAALGSGSTDRKAVTGSHGLNPAEQSLVWLREEPMSEPSLCRMRHSGSTGRMFESSECRREWSCNDTRARLTVESRGLTQTRKGCIEQGNPDRSLAMQVGGLAV